MILSGGGHGDAEARDVAVIDRDEKDETEGYPWLEE